MTNTPKRRSVIANTRLRGCAGNGCARACRLGRPTEHGFIERPHQLVDQQTMLGVELADPVALQPALNKRGDFLNRDYPSRSLVGQAPLTAQPAADHSGRPYRLDQEADLLDLPRVYDYLAQHRWFRHVTVPGQFTLGTYRYGLGKAWANQTVEVHFDPHTQEFICQSEDGQYLQRLPANGLSKAALMGEFHLEPISKPRSTRIPMRCGRA